MAIVFEAQQRLSQDAEGRTLTLIDFSNYNGITPVPGDPYVNSSGNDDGLDIAGFVTRKWILEELDGTTTEAEFPYDFLQINKCSILIDQDKYLRITMAISTALNTYTSTIETGLHRQAEYKLYIASDNTNNECCKNLSDQNKIDAKDFIDSAKFKVEHYDPSGFNKDINAANSLLDSVRLPV